MVHLDGIPRMEPPGWDPMDGISWSNDYEHDEYIRYREGVHVVKAVVTIDR